MLKVYGSVQMRVLEQHLAAAGPNVMGRHFGIGDIPVGLIVNRWFAINFQKPDFKAVSAYCNRLTERPGYRPHGRNGTA
jgi:glutathione S-transferase